MTNNKQDYRVVRAHHTASTIRVYQAYSHTIADAALAAQRFVPPFKMERMTWIKPSFLWMMYRAGWSYKDAGQARILAIDISREGFEWALANACIAHFEHPTFSSHDEWQARIAATNIRIQWDPERNFHGQPINGVRSLQLGLRGDAVQRYVNEWTVAIHDVTELAQTMKALVDKRDLAAATELLPKETPYSVPETLHQVAGLLRHSE